MNITTIYDGLKTIFYVTTNYCNFNTLHFLLFGIKFSVTSFQVRPFKIRQVTAIGLNMSSASIFKSPAVGKRN